MIHNGGSRRRCSALRAVQGYAVHFPLIQESAMVSQKKTTRSKAKPATSAKPKAKPARAAKPKKLKPNAKLAKEATPAPAAKHKAGPSPARYTPAFQLVEHESGQVSLILCGPGYAWERVARKVARAAKLRRVSFDPEASMFCAYGPDRAALVKLSELLQPYLDDREKFREVEKAARAEGND
jgi:hypothetical protein